MFLFFKNDFPADCSSQNAGETPFLSLSNPPTPLLPGRGFSSTTFLGEEMKRKKKKEEKRQQRRGPWLLHSARRHAGLESDLHHCKSSVRFRKAFLTPLPHTLVAMKCAAAAAAAAAANRQDTRTKEEVGGARRLLPAERHAELRGDAVDKEETKAAATVYFFVVGWSAVRNGGDWVAVPQPFKVLESDSRVRLLSSNGRYMQGYSKTMNPFGDASVHFSSITDHLK